MKVVQVVTQMEAGGAQHVAISLSNALSLKNYDTEIWFLYKKRAINSVSQTRVFFDRQPSNPFQYLRIICTLAYTILTFRPDILISHTHYANVLCHAFSTVFRVPTRIAVHHNPRNTYPAFIRNLDSILGSRGCYTHIVAVSQCSAETFRFPNDPRCNRKIVVIPNTIPDSYHTVIVDRSIQRQHFGIPPEVLVLLNIGRLHPQKNQHFLLTLLPYLPGVYLVIVGDGELRAELTQTALRLGVSDRTIFTGEIPHDNISDLIRMSDIFTFPSLYEALPLSLLEAMHGGLPIIINDIPSAREIINRSGFVLPLNNITWINTVNKLHNNVALRNEFSEKSRNASKKYSLTSMATHYETLFNK